MRLINKRYKDIFAQYIHRGEPTPLTIGTLVVCALCFLILIIATFTQINFSHPWFEHASGIGFVISEKDVSYNPLIPAMIFIIYILSEGYSYLMFIAYLLVGFFVWPVFAFGGGLDYTQNYIFGHLSGFLFAILITSAVLRYNQGIKARILAAVFGVLTIHICGFLYCVILALFKVIDFSLIAPIMNVISVGNILYDILFSCAAILIAPYVKNILWICMKPKPDNHKKKSKNIRKRNQIIGDDVYQHRQNYN